MPAARPRPSLGIDIGGTGIKLGLISPAGKTLARARLVTRRGIEPRELLLRLARSAEAACREARVSPGSLGPVGLAVAGAVDRQRGVVTRAVNLDWTDVPAAAILAEILDRPVILENDVRAAMYAEFRLGACRGCRNALGIWLGTGVGGGLIINGELFYGSHDTAGEYGRGVVLPWAPPGQGSLEQICSRTGILETVARLARADRTSALPLSSKKDPAKIDPALLARAYKRGDPLVCEVVDHAALVLGTSIGGAVTLLSLDRVVLGGGLSHAMGRRFFQTVQRAVRRSAFPEVCQQVPVVLSKLGDDAGPVGAALLAAAALSPAHSPEKPRAAR